VFLRNACWLSMESLTSNPTKPFNTVVHGTPMTFKDWNSLMLTRELAHLTKFLIVSLLCGLLTEGTHIESECRR
jgi:hypothetical protein